MTTRRFVGAFHAHSSFSYDSKVPLAALIDTLARRGYDFLLLTEHDDKLDAAQYAEVVATCDALSRPGFLVVPGLEVRCWRTPTEQWHIAAIGVRTWIPRGEIDAVVAAIHAAGGLAVLLHPHKFTRDVDWRALAPFDGVELWNGKEDGSWSPPAHTVRFGLDVARHAGRPLYLGHDLHALHDVRPLALVVDLPALTADDVLRVLRTGAFGLRARGMSFPAREGPGALQRVRMAGWRLAFASYVTLRRRSGIGRVVAALNRLREGLRQNRG